MTYLLQLGRVLGMLLLACSVNVAAAGQAALRADMERLLVEEGITGAVWMTLSPSGDGVGAAGFANTDLGRMMTPNNRVHIGSVSKVVLATGVLRLITTGQLSLDTPVVAVLPNLGLINAWSASEPVRIRHLLAHTAGLDDLRFWQAFSTRPTENTPLIEAFTGIPSLLRLRTKPGSTYSYSNMGYGLLGLVIESITGMRYEHYLDTRLLQPLSMADSSFEFVSQVGVHSDDTLAMGHFENGRTQAAVAIYLRSAGQFTTTAADMAIFSRFLMGDGVIDQQPFIDKGLLAALAQPEGTEAALAGLAIGHGLALAGRDRHGVVGMCHPGTVVGFRAMLCLYSEQGKAFFVALNTDSETADYNRFDALLINALGVAPAKQQASTSAVLQNMDDWQGIYVPAPNRMEQFSWVDKVLNFVTVRSNGATLDLKPFQSYARELVPVDGMLFRATDRTINSHVFFTSAHGRQVISDGLHNYEKTSLVRMLPHWASLIFGLAGLSWIFIAGFTHVIAGNLRRHGVLLLPFMAICALVLPVPFFLRQSFLQLGDPTVASVLLALVTGFLPLAMLLGIFKFYRSGPKSVLRLCDVIACTAALQWTLLLMTAGLLPFRLWI